MRIRRHPYYSDVRNVTHRYLSCRQKLRNILVDSDLADHLFHLMLICRCRSLRRSAIDYSRVEDLSSYYLCGRQKFRDLIDDDDLADQVFHNVLTHREGSFVFNPIFPEFAGPATMRWASEIVTGPLADKFRTLVALKF